MNKLNSPKASLVISAVIGGLIVIGFLYFANKQINITNPITVNTPEVGQSFGGGASAGPESSNGRRCYGGVCYDSTRVAFSGLSSSTLCKIPASIGSSTLRVATLKTKATSSSMFVRIYKINNQSGATGTLIGTGAIPANTDGALVLVATTTALVTGAQNATTTPANPFETVFSYNQGTTTATTDIIKDSLMIRVYDDGSTNSTPLDDLWGLSGACQAEFLMF